MGWASSWPSHKTTCVDKSAASCWRPWLALTRCTHLASGKCVNLTHQLHCGARSHQLVCSWTRRQPSLDRYAFASGKACILLFPRWHTAFLEVGREEYSGPSQDMALRGVGNAMSCVTCSAHLVVMAKHYKAKCSGQPLAILSEYLADHGPVDVLIWPQPPCC
jgi:hypothetical protein